MTALAEQVPVQRFKRVSSGSNSSSGSNGAAAAYAAATVTVTATNTASSAKPTLLKNSSFTKVEALLEQQASAAPGHALPPSKLPRDVRLACRKGIPAVSRPQTYFYLSGGLHKQATSLPSAYQTLAASSASSTDDATLLAVESAVSSLYTSFVRAPQFLSASFQEALSRVVLASAAGGAIKGHLEHPRPLVHVAALLLMTMGKANEERVFWTLSALTEDRLFPGCRGELSLGSSVELRVLQRLVDKRLPRVAEHLKKLQTDVTPIAGCWFTTLFTASLPLEVVLRIWDCIMLEGSKVLIRVALALIKKYESAILSCMHADMLRKVTESRVRCTTDAQELLDLAFKGIGALKSSCLADLRCLACAELAKQPRPAVGWACPLSLSPPV